MKKVFAHIGICLAIESVDEVFSDFIRDATHTAKSTYSWVF